MLIEVMVGSIVLAIATVALLDGLDGAQSTGTRNKARSVAAALAEQDQERMRSVPVLSLVDMIGTPQTRTVTVRNVDYTVKSTASWAPDNGGVISCSNNTRTAANVRIVSEVTSGATRGTVDEASLVTPPAGTVAEGLGRAIVKVTNRTGAGSPSVPVTLNGPANYVLSTNSLGCAIFSFIPVGTYTASVGGLGVDWQGNNPATKSLTVTEGGSTTTPFEVDTPATIQATFDTKVGTAAATTASSRYLTVANSNLSVGEKTFEATPAGSPNTLIEATNLFPFVNGYGAYAGSCDANNPAAAPTNNSSLLRIYTPSAGQLLATSPKIRMPAINLRVTASSSTTNSTATGFNGATVTIYSNDSGCSQTFTTTSAPKTYSGTTYQGALDVPGLPYGTYKICAIANVPTVGIRHGHADIRVGGAYSSGHANEVVSNTAEAGNTTAWGTNGFIRIVLNQTNATNTCHKD